MAKVKMTLSGYIDLPEEHVGVAEEMDVDIAATLLLAEGEDLRLKVSKARK